MRLYAMGQSPTQATSPSPLCKLWFVTVGYTQALARMCGRGDQVSAPTRSRIMRACCVRGVLRGDEGLPVFLIFGPDKVHPRQGAGVGPGTPFGESRGVSQLGPIAQFFLSPTLSTCNVFLHTSCYT